MKMMYTLLVLATMLGTVQVVTGLVDNTKYKVLTVWSGQNERHWDARCKGELNITILQ